MTEGGEAHGGRHKCYSPMESDFATQKNCKYTGHTHGEKLMKIKERRRTKRQMNKEKITMRN